LDLGQLVIIVLLIVGILIALLCSCRQLNDLNQSLKEKFVFIGVPFFAHSQELLTELYETRLVFD